ncbi:MAG: hypothetical protein ABS68_02180 [Niastella sp. SCN 39-18]|nr:lycopene cyclase domain-containing protein [Sphingobacteriales bacterium]ODT54163.1 MAG: hypothetical protein ABS68_02180 [Niastella sp. SCN 39-18]OJW09540.1 MAG: hypothetical protein BGO53_06605 [Sphingobacteriales bacterium 39-19]
MNPHYTYFLILAISITGPLALSFDKKVAFWKQYRYLFPAMLLPAVFYILWDAWFTAHGVWWFNENYIIGFTLAGLPIEEILFFFVVPYCCVFIYECIRCYFPKIKNHPAADFILKSLAILSLTLGLFYEDRAYSFFSFFFFAVFVMLFYSLKRYFLSFHVSAFLISWAITLIPFLIVNGFLTALPVVLYNDAENLGKRIYSIPIEDSIYGMLLIFLNIILFEKLREKK